MDNRRGLVIVHTGEGKGKTTAALGMAIRSWGNGMRVLILQFIKGSWTYGELKAIETLPADVLKSVKAVSDSHAKEMKMRRNTVVPQKSSCKARCMKYRAAHGT